MDINILLYGVPVGTDFGFRISGCLCFSSNLVCTAGTKWKFYGFWLYQNSSNRGVVLLFLIFLVHMLIGVWKGLKVDEITSDISRIIWRSKSITNGFVIVDLMIKNSGKVL